ncbi:hypothetical protein ACMFF8_23800 [Escherichia coli]
MQGKVDEQQSNDIEAEFGYYPVEVNVKLMIFLYLLYPVWRKKQIL